MIEEKRRYARSEVRWPVTLKTSRGSMEAETKDVSLGGVFIRSRNPLSPDEVLAMVVKVPDLEQPLKIDGKVIWSNISGSDNEFTPHGMGVLFTEIFPEDRQLSLL